MILRYLNRTELGVKVDGLNNLQIETLEKIEQTSLTLSQFNYCKKIIQTLKYLNDSGEMIHVVSTFIDLTEGKDNNHIYKIYKRNFTMANKYEIKVDNGASVFRKNKGTGEIEEFDYVMFADRRQFKDNAKYYKALQLQRKHQRELKKVNLKIEKIQKRSKRIKGK